MSGQLRVAIVHYHLRAGGVTKVIEHSASALVKVNAKVVILAGTPPPEPLSFECRVVPQLRYDESGRGLSIDTLVDTLCDEARVALAGPPDIWHFHNHSLGKSIAVPQVVSRLADRGEHLLLQIHDFPEDGRPTIYQRLLSCLGHGQVAALSDTIYPAGSHVHYAVLNGRDLSFMQEAGTPVGRLHFLPNCVAMDAASSSLPNCTGSDDEGLIVYPTRGIRRKNLGEFLLWAAVSGKKNRFVTTLAPKNPQARPVYEAWVTLAQSLRLPVEFGVATKCNQSFMDVLLSAKAIMSTSVAEGFGLAFLEPWLLHRQLFGRNLPDITGDFASAGLNLGQLYNRLDVPVEWIGREKLFQRVETAQRKYFHDYGQDLPIDAATRALDKMVQNDKVDFGCIDEPFQEMVIRRICESDSARSELQPVSPFIEGDSFEDVLEQNRQIVLQEFGLSNYGARLMEVYREIMACRSDSSPRVSSKTLLERFLLPERFSLLRTT